MKTPTAEHDWNNYLKEKIPQISELIKERGYVLDRKQPHIQGERFLMQAMTTAGGKKLILLGKTSEGVPVIIKATDNRSGKEELLHEQTCRRMLQNIDFAYDSFHSPEEIGFIQQGKYTISIQKFIEQEKPFLERSLEEQFKFALQSLKTQEKARATTRKHFTKVARVFGNRESSDYLKLHDGFVDYLERQKVDPTILKTNKDGNRELKANRERIEQYCGFLTHTDFVPHNFRIKGDILYLLDFSSLRFGNKNESWARFLNFMTLYNPKLESLLIEYVENNRSSEERESLQLMRIFRLGEIISYYVKNTKKSTGDLAKLNGARISFWNDVLTAELENKRVDQIIVSEYKNIRDSLRSKEEKERQVGLH